jgi:signal transduction histidine kinase
MNWAKIRNSAPSTQKKRSDPPCRAAGNETRCLPAPAEKTPLNSKSTGRRLAQVKRELDAARQVSEVLFNYFDPDDVIKHSLLTALEVVDAESGSILIAEPEAKELVFRHSTGKHPVRSGTAFPWDKGIAGTVFHSCEPVVIGNVKEDKRHFPDIDIQTDHVTRDMVAVPLKRSGGKPVGVLEVVNKRRGHFDEDDLSLLMVVSAISASSLERARLYDEAKLAEVAKLLGNIGHDIKNLLTPVVCGAGILEEELGEDSSLLRKQSAERLEAGRARCRNVIAGMIDSSRRIQDRVKEISDCIKGLSSEPRFGPCRMEDIAAEVFEALGLLSLEKGISLEKRDLDTLPPIVGDERRLFNAFYNLVNNAISEVPPGGSITLSGREHPREAGVMISVVDTGRGMPSEIRDSLFTVRAMSSKSLGTGLGTKIVKDVIDAHGGRITVQSEVGRGAAFEIFLPLDPEAPPPS